MTEYWGDSQESYGPVSTDKIQTVFLSSTQTVTEMKVAQGDEVKKGDVLMTFDTTLSDLQLERKRLEVEKLKLDLETAQKKLKDIRNMKPMSIVSSDDFDYGGENGGANRPLEGNYELSDKQFYDGKDEETALICWLRNGYTVNDSILEKARQLAEDLQTKNQPDPTEPDTEPTTEPTTEPPTQPSTGAPYTTEYRAAYAAEYGTADTTEHGSVYTFHGESSEGEDGEQSSASAAENPARMPTVSVEGLLHCV